MIIEALRECYPLTADDSFVSTYDKLAALYKSIQKTITVDQANIDQLRKSYSERLISDPSKEFGGNRLFQLNLDEALGKDAAYMAKPSLSGLLTAT